MKHRICTALAATALFAAISMPTSAQCIFDTDKKVQQLPTICPLSKGHDYVLKFFQTTDGRFNLNLDYEVERAVCNTGGKNSYQFFGSDVKFKTLLSAKAAVRAAEDLASMELTADEVKAFYEYVVLKMKHKEVARKN